MNFGNNTFSRSAVLANQVDRSNSRYSISLPIPANASWATVVISSSNGAATDQCFVVQNGALAIGAAQELSKNLLQNGGFENQLIDWELCSGDESADFSNNAHLGERSVAIDNGNCVYQEVTVEPGADWGLAIAAFRSFCWKSWKLAPVPMISTVLAVPHLLVVCMR